MFDLFVLTLCGIIGPLCSVCSVLIHRIAQYLQVEWVYFCGL